MNISQLERIKKMIHSIRAEVKTDTGGAMWINDELKRIEGKVDTKLKNLVWKRYLEAEG